MIRERTTMSKITHPTPTQPIPQSDLQVLTRYLSTRPEALSEIHSTGDCWQEIADECLRRRAATITDVLSNDTLRAIASGAVNFPALCAALMSPPTTVSGDQTH